MPRKEALGCPEAESPSLKVLCCDNTTLLLCQNVIPTFFSSLNPCTSPSQVSQLLLLSKRKALGGIGRWSAVIWVTSWCVLKVQELNSYYFLHTNNSNCSLAVKWSSCHRPSSTRACQPLGVSNLRQLKLPVDCLRVSSKLFGQRMGPQSLLMWTASPTQTP